MDAATLLREAERYFARSPASEDAEAAGLDALIRLVAKQPDGAIRQLAEHLGVTLGKHHRRPTFGDVLRIREELSRRRKATLEARSQRG